MFFVLFLAIGKEEEVFAFALRRLHCITGSADDAAASTVNVVDA